MMRKTENRISAFIETLGGTGMTEENEAFLLSADMDSIGGDNGGNCKNSLQASCENVKNKGNCINWGVCAGSDNGKDCENHAQVPPQ